MKAGKDVFEFLKEDETINFVKDTLTEMYDIEWRFDWDKFGWPAEFSHGEIRMFL